MGKDSWSSEHRSLHNSYFPFAFDRLVSYIMSIHIAAQQGDADKILLLRVLFVLSLCGELP